METPEPRLQAILKEIDFLWEEVWKMDWKIQNLVKLITPHAHD